jgi:hypothetical protein
MTERIGLQCTSAATTLAHELARLSLLPVWQHKDIDKAIDGMYNVVTRLMYDLLVDRAQLLTHFKVTRFCIELFVGSVHPLLSTILVDSA